MPAQGTAAVPKCFHFSPDGAKVFWHSQASTCRKPAGALSRKPSDCAKTEFPAEEKGGVMVATSVLCFQPLVVTSCAADLMPGQVGKSPENEVPGKNTFLAHQDVLGTHPHGLRGVQGIPAPSLATRGCCYPTALDNFFGCFFAAGHSVCGQLQPPHPSPSIPMAGLMT